MAKSGKKKARRADPVAQGGPQPPSDRPHKTVRDARTHFAALSARTPVDEAFKAAFMQSKIAIAHTQPTLDLAARELAVKSVTNRLGSGASHAFAQLIARGSILSGPPVPGGVGYGGFYNPAFKTGWGHGTSLAFDIVCPTPPGGNVNTWLYLTATNRATLGVEAFISYNGQSDTHFRVFDWARTDQWQTDIPLSGLSNYLTTESEHGHPYQVLPVWNGTWQINATTYRNQVLLYNRVRGGWDLVYQYDYAATDAQQKAGWVGSWGPIVETFQPLYTGTSAIGALRTRLISANNSGVWGSWALLGAANSSIRTDHLGFSQVFLDPNYAFTVVS
jgi:hypothetical protein